MPSPSITQEGIRAWSNGYPFRNTFQNYSHDSCVVGFCHGLVLINPMYVFPSYFTGTCLIIHVRLPQRLWSNAEEYGYIYIHRILVQTDNITTKNQKAIEPLLHFTEYTVIKKLRSAAHCSLIFHCITTMLILQIVIKQLMKWFSSVLEGHMRVSYYIIPSDLGNKLSYLISLKAAKHGCVSQR